jgi:hypothetical protein
MKGVISVAVVTFIWVWDSLGLAINESESLVEVWAVLKTSDIATDILYLLMFLDTSFNMCRGHHILSMGIFWVAVVTFIWVWDSSGLSINESESFVEVWAMLKRSDVRSDILLLMLGQLVVSLAVVVDLWVWDSFGLSVSEGKSLIKIWAVRKTVNAWSPVWLRFLKKLVS